MDNLDFNYFCAHCTKSREYRQQNCFVKYRVKRFEAGEYIAFKGERVCELSLLVSGGVVVSFPLPTGDVLRSVPHSAPYPMGAVALLGRENKYRVDIQASEQCDIITVSREQIEQQIMSCREFMLSYFDYSTSKLDLFIEHLTLLSQRSIAAKVAYYILFCSEDGVHYSFGRSMRSLAEHLCVERPSLSRVVASLVAQGIITHSGGQGRIVDMGRLRALVE